MGVDASQDCNPATDAGQTGCCWFVDQGPVDGGTSFPCGDAGVVCDMTTQYCMVPVLGGDLRPGECQWLSSLPACNSSSLCACQKHVAMGCADVGGAITLAEEVET
jgi:hypothetical protein